MAKNYTVGNVTYEGLPDSFDPAIYENQLAIENQLQGSIQQGIQAAEQAPGELQRAQGASLLDMRRDAARTLQATRGLGTSGRGLGIARDVGIATDTKSAALRGQYATDISQARQEAAAAKTAGLIEQGKLLEAQASRKAAGSRATQRAQEIMQKYAGTIYTTASDRNRMVQDLQAELAATTDPQAAMVLQNAIDGVKSGKTKNSGTIDLSFG